MQHHDETGSFEVLEYLLMACTAWELAGCPCCAPSVLDDALERLSDEEWRRLGAFAEGLLAASQFHRNEVEGCTCPESMEPCPLHNTALADLFAREALASTRKETP